MIISALCVVPWIDQQLERSSQYLAYVWSKRKRAQGDGAEPADWPVSRIVTSRPVQLTVQLTFLKAATSSPPGHAGCQALLSMGAKPADLGSA